MKYVMMFVMMFVVANVVAQETQCVDVPKGQKLVLVPWFVPVKELVWKWHPAELPQEEEECDELAVSPSACEPE